LLQKGGPTRREKGEKKGGLSISLLITKEKGSTTACRKGEKKERGEVLSYNEGERKGGKLMSLSSPRRGEKGEENSPILGRKSFSNS